MDSSDSDRNAGEWLMGFRGAAVNHRRPPIRQPVSCLPCRRSKIKCDRKTPCGSCRRRQCIQVCSYGPGQCGDTAGSDKGNDSDLRARLDYLESLVRQGRLRTDDEDYTASENGEIDASMIHENAGLVTPPGTSASNPTVSFYPSVEGSSTTASTESTQNPGSVGFIGTLRGDDSAGESVSYQIRQSRWDGILEKPLGDHVYRTSAAEAAPASSMAGINFPFDTGTLTDLDTLLALLPPRQQCDYLIMRYFTFFSPLFHVLHDPTFHAEYRGFTRDPRSVKLSWLALLFVCLSLAVTTLEDHDPVLSDLGREPSGHENIKALATRFRGAAMRCLAASQFLVHHRLSTLQALIILIYAINHSQGPGQSWTLLGLTLNIGIALGCHVDGQALHLSALETEQRRRCWAGILMLHTIQATSFGNIDVMRLSDYQVSLPADVNDVDITPEGIQAPSSQPTQMSYMLFKFRLYKMSSDICKKLFGSCKPSLDTIFGLDREIALEQQQWDARYLLDGGQNLLQYHNQAHWNILHCYANQFYLLLHRPFFRLKPSEPGYYPEARSRCVAAGLTLLDIYKQFCVVPYLKQYRWFTCGLGSFYALHGAVALSACLVDGHEDNETPRCRTAFDEVVNRFAELQHQSRICSKALPVLRYLQSLLPPRDFQLHEFASSRPWLDAGLQPASSDPDPMFDEIFESWTQANHWTSPDAIDWNIWNTVLDPSEH